MFNVINLEEYRSMPLSKANASERAYFREIEREVLAGGDIRLALAEIESIEMHTDQAYLRAKCARVLNDFAHLREH